MLSACSSPQVVNVLDILAANPLLLLFLVAAVGYPLGRVSVGGTRIGVAAVLFAGLAFGALDARIRLPDVIYLLGLVLFVYPIGLASGPTFFRALRRKGLANNLLVAGVLVFSMLLTYGVALVLGLDGPVAAGLFAGSLTNTPALAAAIEAVRAAAPAELVETVRARPVIGYSIAYPMGVLGMIGALLLAERAWRIDFAQDARRLADTGEAGEVLESRTFEVLRDRATTLPLVQIARAAGLDVIFTRLERSDGIALVDAATVAEFGAHVSAVGTPRTLDLLEKELGRGGERRLDLDRTDIDYRRIFVSSHEVAGRTLRELDLRERFGAIVTRVRRGDVELRPHAGMVLELGDRVRIVARRSRMDEVSRFFGDSYRALSEVDVTSFALGLFLGLLLGLVPFPLPGGVTVRLGLAGGPLLVGLVLGTIGFTGRLVWTMPYSANLTVRQLGLVLFLAGIGTQAGFPFVRTLASAEGVLLFAAGAAITMLAALVLLWVGYRLLGVPFSLLSGMLAGFQTQPAVLGFATDQAKSDLPNIGYATVYPTAIILKIVLVQLLLLLS
jgi:putative transport protein